MSLSLSRRMWGAHRGQRQRDPAIGNRQHLGRPSKQAWQSLPRTSSAGLIDCFGLTDNGKKRERNEDQFLIADMRQPVAMLHSFSSPENEIEQQDMLNANLLLVADGVGGHAGGSRASRLAMEGVVEYLHDNRRLFADDDRREQQIGGELKAALEWAQERIRAEAEESPELTRMGTTLTLAYLDWPTVYIAHCGDSRAYIYGGHELVQMTRDQTIPQMLADMGAIDQDLVEHHPLRNVLASLLSSDVSQFMPCVFSRRLVPGDQLLLCTDGLTKHVSPGKIAEILDSAQPAADACRELIVAANEAGGSDNITAVLAHFGHRIRAVSQEPASSSGGSSAYRPGWEFAFSA